MIVVKESFYQQVGATYLRFEAGSVIIDPVLCNKVLENGGPVEEVKGASDLISCPHCRRAFTVKQAVQAEKPPLAEEDDD